MKPSSSSSSFTRPPGHPTKRPRSGWKIPDKILFQYITYSNRFGFEVLRIISIVYLEQKQKMDFSGLHNNNGNLKDYQVQQILFMHHLMQSYSSPILNSITVNFLSAWFFCFLKDEINPEAKTNETWPYCWMGNCCIFACIINNVRSPLSL